MSQALEINGVEMVGIKAAAKISNYSSDYISRLARQEKIVASYVDRQWYVDPDSLLKYSKEAATEKELRKIKLSEERKEQLAASSTVITKEEVNKKSSYHYFPSKHIAAASLLAVALIVGVSSQVSLLSLTDQSASTVVMNEGAISARDEEPKNEQPNVPAVTEEINFSHESVRVATFADIDEGILLLPQNKNGELTVNAQELFSDEVTISTDETGQQYVSRFNAVTKEIERIPFVIVPVSNKETP